MQRTEFTDRLVLPIGGTGLADAVLSIEVWQVKDDVAGSDPAPTTSSPATVTPVLQGDASTAGEAQATANPYSGLPAGLLRTSRPQGRGGADSNSSGSESKPRKGSKASRVFGKLKKKIVKKFLRSKFKRLKSKASATAAKQQEQEQEQEAAATAAAAAAGMMLVGTASIPLAAYVADQRVQVSVELESVAGSNSAGTVEIMLEPSAKRQRVSDAYRRCHGALLDKVVRYDPDSAVYTSIPAAAGAGAAAAGLAVPAVASGLGAAVDAVIALHADMARLTPLQRAVDYFEAIMGAHAEEGVTCTRMYRAFEPIATVLGAAAAMDAADADAGVADGQLSTRPRSTSPDAATSANLAGTDPDAVAVAPPAAAAAAAASSARAALPSAAPVIELDDILTTAESDSLIAAIETAVTSCLFRGARPVQCFPPGVLGKVEASACVRLLRLAFACEPWQEATMGTMVDNALPSIDTATVYESPLLMMAATLIEEQGTSW